jgi:hypothetical protein
MAGADTRHLPFINPAPHSAGTFQKLVAEDYLEAGPFFEPFGPATPAPPPDEVVPLSLPWALAPLFSAPGCTLPPAAGPDVAPDDPELVPIEFESAAKAAPEHAS